MGYAVSAPLVLVRNEEGSFSYLYDGAPVPSYVSQQDLDRLVDGELISKVDDEDAGSGAYASQSKDDLLALVDSRNEGRDDADKIVVGGKGNKPDVVAALEADDSK